VAWPSGLGRRISNLEVPGINHPPMWIYFPTFNSLTVLLASHQLGILIVYFLFRLSVYVFAVSPTSSTVLNIVVYFI